MNNVAINICAQVFVWTYIFISLYITRKGIAESYGKSLFSFSLNENVCVFICENHFAKFFSSSERKHYLSTGKL